MYSSDKCIELENITIVKPDPKGHVWYALTYKWIVTIKYRIPILHSTDPKKLNKKKGPSKDA